MFRRHIQLRDPGTSLRGSSEVEVVLIIHEDFDAVLNQLSSLRSIRNYRLEPGPSKTIRDTYFDTPDGRLRKRGTNVRIREIDGAFFISTKWGARRTLKGATLRKEVEVPWSERALRNLIKDLKLEIGGSPWHQFSEATPIESMKTIGLQMTQDRETNREVRNISSWLKPTLVIAELAIDRVTYHIGNHNASIFEVEVEEKAKKSSSVVRDVTKALIHAYQPALQKWSQGKLVTGLAIQRLLETEPVDNLLDHDRLRPEAFIRIDQTVRSWRKSWSRRLVRTLMSRN